MNDTGQRLRLLREGMGLTLRDVESATLRLAHDLNNDEYQISLSRLSDIETKGTVPSIFRLYALSAVYRIDLLELLQWYGINTGHILQDIKASEPPRTHLNSALKRLESALVPLKLDPSFNPAATCNFGRMIERWGTVPLASLSTLAEGDYTYGYIGSEDLTMYPLVLPGAFVQIDESKNIVSEGGWRSEYERPIYFIETREGFYCAWCTVRGAQLILQPHPLSPVPPRIFRHPQEAEVLGQVV